MEVIGTTVSELDVSFVIFGHVEARKERTMSKEGLDTFRYRVLRYTPNLIRDEWVNIGVLLEDVGSERREMRLIQDDSEYARVRKLHPNADLGVLRALAAEFETRLGDSRESGAAEFEKFHETLSNVLEFSPAKGLLARDFKEEMHRLFREYVEPPPRVRRGIVETTRGWFRQKLEDVFRRHRILGKLQSRVSVEEFTEPGDSLRIDFGYQNGVQGYIQSVPLDRDPTFSKVLAYTVGRIRLRVPDCEFTAVTETELSSTNRRHQFMARLFEDHRITVVPLNRVEKFAEELRVRLQ